jgi:polysaccharide export outer membrane protein
MQTKEKLSALSRFFMIIAISSLIFSCNSSKIVTRENFIYFQNGLDSMKYIQSKEPVIQNNDLLSIQVISTSLNQEQTLPFNLPASAAGVSSGYLVNMAGNIEMPVIGTVKAAGLTQVQLQKSIIEKLNPLVKDPSVVIHFLQFKVNVLGEVRTPGTQKFEADRVTIIDAISAAGDLTDNGKRENITVIREEANTRKIYKVDIRNGSLFQSPAYLLQSNDIVYVGASDQKFLALKGQAKASAQNGLQVVVTVLGLITSIALVIRVFK